MRPFQFAQVTVLIFGIAFSPAVHASDNTFVDQTEIAVSKGIRSLRSQHPEPIEFISVKKGIPLISHYARPVTWLSQYATGSGFTIGNWYSQSVTNLFEVSVVLEKEVYKLGSSTVHGSKLGELRLSSPLNSFTYKDPLRPSRFLSDGREDVVLLLPLIDPLGTEDFGNASIAMIADNGIFPQAKISKDPPQVLLERNEKYLLEAFAPGAKTFDTDWYIPSMSNIFSTGSTMFGNPSRITTFEWDDKTVHKKRYIEIALFPDNHFVTISATSSAKQFDSVVLPVIYLLKQYSIIRFPLIQSPSLSNATGSGAVKSPNTSFGKKTIVRCSGTKAAVLLCRKQTSKVKKP